MKDKEPRFLTREQVDRLHSLELDRFGGSAGVRDEGLVESALASAKNAYYLGNGDLFDVAAAYAFHIAESQAFIDGNKRTGIGAGLAFLETNGATTKASDDMLYDAMIAIANKTLKKSGLAALMRNHQ